MRYYALELFYTTELHMNISLEGPAMDVTVPGSSLGNICLLKYRQFGDKTSSTHSKSQ